MTIDPELLGGVEQNVNGQFTNDLEQTATLAISEAIDTSVRHDQLATPLNRPSKSGSKK